MQPVHHKAQARPRVQDLHQGQNRGQVPARNTQEPNRLSPNPINQHLNHRRAWAQAHNQARNQELDQGQVVALKLVQILVQCLSPAREVQALTGTHPLNQDISPQVLLDPNQEWDQMPRAPELAPAPPDPLHDNRLQAIKLNLILVPALLQLCQGLNRPLQDIKLQHPVLDLERHLAQDLNLVPVLGLAQHMAQDRNLAPVRDLEALVQLMDLILTQERAQAPIQKLVQLGQALNLLPLDIKLRNRAQALVQDQLTALIPLVLALDQLTAALVPLVQHMAQDRNLVLVWDLEALVQPMALTLTRE